VWAVAHVSGAVSGLSFELVVPEELAGADQITRDFAVWAPLGADDVLRRLWYATPKARGLPTGADLCPALNRAPANGSIRSRCPHLWCRLRATQCRSVRSDELSRAASRVHGSWRSTQTITSRFGSRHMLRRYCLNSLVSPPLTDLPPRPKSQATIAHPDSAMRVAPIARGP
jgi:hypothetical protein